MSIKRTFLAAVFLFPSIVSLAQFKKGDRMVGASIASVVINSGNSDITVAQIGSNTSKITSYNISLTPSMGWFLSDKVVVGATLNINPNGNTTSYEQGGTTYQKDKSNAYNLGLGGFLRYYFNNSGSMMPFGEVGLNGGFSNLKTSGFFYGGTGVNAYKITYSGNSSSGSYFNGALTLGITKMLNEHAGLDVYMGYNYSYNKNVFDKTTQRDNGNDGSIDETLKNETTTKFTNNGFVIGVGLQVFLRKKK